MTAVLRAEALAARLYADGLTRLGGSQLAHAQRVAAGVVDTGDEGIISVFELPLDMAHLLRGITNRQRLKETLDSKSGLVELLHRMEKSEHTGTLEIQAGSGSASTP